MERIKQYILDQVLSNQISKQHAAELLQEIIRADKNGQKPPAQTDIAIIGMACRFPKASDLEALWNLLVGEEDAIDAFPYQRSEDVKVYIANKLNIPENEVRYFPGGYLAQIDQFDNALFHISPGEARMIDPQQRIFLELVWRAMEDAQLRKDALAGTRTGLYVGYSDNQYRELNSIYEPSAMIGNLSSMMAGRTAYAFDLHGPVQTIDTTCSSGLVAVHNACQAIVSGECEMAIAGGAKLMLFPAQLERYGVRIESEDSRCKAFADDADGIVSSEGAVVLFLKRLDRALKDKNPIRAIIKGSAVNSDGKSNGVASPNALAQADVIQSAWEKARIDAEHIGYIEAHGTGTKLGDPIELEGLTTAFRRFTDRRRFCAIGSIKSNIGHADSVAGLAGLVKLVLAIEHGVIPATLHVKEENRLFSLTEAPIYINKKTSPWPNGHGQRLGAVSSFGLSGTNCHMVVSQHLAAEEPALKQAAPQRCLLTVSANSLTQLTDYLASYQEFFQSEQEVRLEEVCYASQTSRTPLSYRVAIGARDKQGLLDSIGSMIQFMQEEPNGKCIESAGVYASFCDYTAPVMAQDAIDKAARQYIQGREPDWAALYSGDTPRVIPIPSYPFDQTKFWIEQRESPDPFTVHEQEEPNVDLEQWYYQQTWVKRAEPLTPQETLAEGGLWIVFAHNDLLARRLKQTRAGEAARIVTVIPGEACQRYEEDRFCVRPARTDDLLWVLKEVLTNYAQGPKHVVHAWTLQDESATGKGGLSSMQDALALGAVSLLCTVKALSTQTRDGSLDLWILSDQFHDKAGEQRFPFPAALWGMSRVIPQEYPRINCYCMEFDALSTQEGFVAQAVASHMMTRPEERDYAISYRKGQCYVQQIEKLRSDEQPAVKRALRSGGTYVLFGGAGHLGLRICLTMAAQVKTRFVLVNRTVLPARETWDDLLHEQIKDKLRFQIEHIRAIEGLGSSVVLVAADATDEHDMRMLGKTLQHYAPIHGIVQATKNIGYEPIRNLSEDVFYRAIADKVTSTVLIDQLVKQYEPGFYLMLSSSSSIIGGVGRADCAAANRFLDVYGPSIDRRATVGCVMNLPGITEKNLQKHEMEVAAFPSMYIEHFEKAVLDVLSHELSFVLVERFDFEEIKKIKLLTRLRFAPALFAKPAAPEPKRTEASLDESGSAQTPVFENAQALYKAVGDLWNDLLGYEVVGSDLDFFELGGDSLMAISLFDKIKDRMGIEMEIADIFAYPSVRKMSDYMIKTYGLIRGDLAHEDDLMSVLSSVENDELSIEEAMNRLMDMPDRSESRD